ncbi:MAG: hypothetical protein V4734_06925, partial [Terriglobus sp.]
ATALMQNKRPSDAAAAFQNASKALAALGQVMPLELRMDWASALMQSQRPLEAQNVLHSSTGLEQSAPAMALLAEAAAASHLRSGN